MSLFRRAKYAVEYILLRILGEFLASLSWEHSLAVGAFLGRFASKIIKKRFDLTVKNIATAFPDKSPFEARTIATKSWENMGVIVTEFLHGASGTREQLLSRCCLHNTEPLRRHLATGKGAIVHIGHIANWEMVGLAFHAAGFNACVVARRIRNPYVDKWVTDLRKAFGGDIIGHKDPFFSCVRNIKRGRLVGILMDQNMPAGEIFTPFFSRMAATTPLTALLSLKTQTPIFPLKVEREGHGIKATFEDPIIPAQAYSEEAMMELINVLNARLEAWITAHPEMWLWVHNRWKREGDAAKFAARMQNAEKTAA